MPAKALEEQTTAPEIQPEPTLTPEEPAAPRRAWYRNARLMVPAVAAVLVLAVCGSIIGGLQGKNSELKKTVAADARTIASDQTTMKLQSSENSDLTQKNEGLQSQVDSLRSSNSDLNSRNSSLASFGAKVTGLVGDLSTCLADKDTVISYWADGIPAPDSFFQTMRAECSQATSEADGLKAAIDNAANNTTS